MDIHALHDRRWILLPGTLWTGAVFDGFLDALAVPRASRHVAALRHLRIKAYTEALMALTEVGAIVTADHADRLEADMILLFGLNPYDVDPSNADDRHALARAVLTTGSAAAPSLRLPPFRGPHPNVARAAILRMADESADDIAAQTDRALHRPGAFDILARASGHVVFLTGNLDEQAPFRPVRMAAAMTPHGRAVRLDGLGHYALPEEPRA